MRRFGIVITATVLFSLLAASQAHAATTYWTATGAHWHDLSSWSCGVPDALQSGCITNGGVAHITEWQSIIRNGKAFASGLTVGHFIGTSGYVSQTGGTATFGSLTVGASTTSSGTYWLKAGKLSVQGHERIGYEGTGKFEQTGGTNTIGGSLDLGYRSGSSGTYNLSGGSLEAADLDINYGWMDIDVSEIDQFAVYGDRASLLNGYIADGAIFDSTLCPGSHLYAVYDSENDWTTLSVIPEPSTLLLLAPGLLGIAGILRRRRFSGFSGRLR